MGGCAVQMQGQDRVETMPGITEYDTQDGFHVLRIHFTADPQKSNPEWIKKEQTGTTVADWEQEMEINFNVPKGKPWYPEVAPHAGA